MAASGVAGTIKRGEVEEKSCYHAHKGAWITVLACATLAVMVSGGLLYHYSVFNHIICYTIIGAGAAIGATIIALIFYATSSTSATIKQTSSRSQPNTANPKNPEKSTITLTKLKEQKDGTILKGSPKNYTYYKENRDVAALAQEIKNWDLATYEKMIPDIMKDSKCSKRMLALLCKDEKFCQSNAMLEAVSSKWNWISDVSRFDVEKSICLHPAFPTTPSALIFIYNLYFEEPKKVEPENGLTLTELFLALVNNSHNTCAYLLLQRDELNMEELFNRLKDNPVILFSLINYFNQKQFDQIFPLAANDPESNKRLFIFITSQFATSASAQKWICENYGLDVQEDYSSFISIILTHACKHGLDIKQGILEYVIKDYIGFHSHSSIHLTKLFNNFLTWTDAQKDSLKMILGSTILGNNISEQFKKEEDVTWFLSLEGEKQMVTWLCNPNNKDLQNEKPILQLLVTVDIMQFSGIICTLDNLHFKELVSLLKSYGFRVDGLVVTMFILEKKVPPNFLLEYLKCTHFQAMNVFCNWFSKWKNQEDYWLNLPEAFKMEFRHYYVNECLSSDDHEDKKEVFQLIFNNIPEDCNQFLKAWGQLANPKLERLLDLFGPKRDEVLKAMGKDGM